MLMNPPHIENFLEACRMWPWADEDISIMQDGDIYIFGMAFFEHVHDIRGPEQCYSQAWLERKSEYWRYRAFSTLQHTRVREPVRASGSFTLENNGTMRFSMHEHAQNGVEILNFVRVCRHLNLLKQKLTEDEVGFFMQHGFRSLMSGLWLDKRQRTRKKLLAVDEKGKPISCYYDFGTEPLLIQEDEINQSIRQRRMIDIQRRQTAFRRLDKHDH